MKRLIILWVCLLAIPALLTAQTTKQEQRKNLTVKEWKKSADGKSARYLDHVTKYDAQGRKCEDIEYNASGKMTDRCVYEYGPNGKVSREIVYDSSNKVVRIRKFEYNTDGTKKKQYNYSPNGKLVSTKEFEYIR